MNKEDALQYHRQEPKGKVVVLPSKPVLTQRDLSLAYSPGVAYPCLEIAEHKEKVYEYTAKGNLVAVISNGTAVLGLGNIGPEASKPVMEGKGVLFKKFAGIDVFDLEVNANSVEEFVAVAKALEPTFGGINIEDVKAPECFEIERRLREEMNIPVMHDDQHGTAIISAAALMNALKLTGRNFETSRFVFIGAGAAALSCATKYLALGARVENVYMFDKDGFIHSSRTDLDEFRAIFVKNTPKPLTLVEAFKGADVFIGLSTGNIVTAEMIAGMAPNPIIFALANPTPEISYELARSTRPDAIIATGRSDYPNQVNNALGFPYIFRGALDVRATTINDAMKIAAAKAIAALAHEPVPDDINEAYAERNMSFGTEYLIPKPLDFRLITWVSMAVAKAAIESGVARKTITDWNAYEMELQGRIGMDQGILRTIVQRAKRSPRRVVFADADTYKICKAIEIVRDEGIATPILLGGHERIMHICEQHSIDLDGVEIIDPMDEHERRERFGEILFQKRKRKGITQHDAVKLMRERTYFGAAMVECGEADAFISGLTKNYPSSIRPALQIIGKEGELVAGMHIVRTQAGYYFFADTTVNKQPTAEQLVRITELVSQAVQKFNVRPRIAMLSYSNFGSNMDELTSPIIDATSRLQRKYPELIVDGDIQANIATDLEILQENFSFSKLAESGANTFIFPSLMAGNIAYKLMATMGKAEVIGPILLGMKKPVHILQLGSSVREIVNMVSIAVLDAQLHTYDRIR